MTSKHKKDRTVDFWRAWAAEPLPHLSIGGELVGAKIIGSKTTGEKVWTLREDQRQIAQWREDEVPGLGSWLATKLAQLHGAWHIARTELGVVKKKKVGGARTAAERKTIAESRNDALMLAARKMLKKNPRLTNSDLARQLHDRGHGGAESLRKRLPKLLRK